MKSLCPRNELIVGITLLLALSLVSTANAEVNYSTGSRVWDESLGLNTTYTWNAQSFSGFYYDLDSGTGSEELEIRNIDRNLDIGEIIYTTVPFCTDFEHAEWGSYQVIGFLGEKYLSGYSDGTAGGAVNSSSLIKEGVLTRVLTDTDEEEFIYSGSFLPLEEGYVLNIVKVDASGDSVWIRLEKDGNLVEDTFLSSNENYVYEIELGNVKEVPIIIVHFGTIFAEAETNAVLIEGIFQVSDAYLKISPGYIFDEMKVTSVGSTGIKLENGGDILLNQSSTIELMEEFKLKVADDTTLRFVPVRERTVPGTYGLRGTVYDGNKDTLPIVWTSLNFEGFYYDLDEGAGAEQLTIESLELGFIPANELVYNCTVQPVQFEHEEWGTFPVIGLFGEAFLPLQRTGDDIHFAKAEKLSKLIIDDDEKYSLRNGEALYFGEGYALKAKQIDVDGNKVWLVFTRNDELVDEEIISLGEGKTGDWFIILDDIEDENDVIVMRVHVNQVFQGVYDSIAQIEGLWLIDYNNAFTIENDDEFGELKVMTIGRGVTGTDPRFGYLEFKNPAPMGLDKNNVQHISEGMSFNIAGSDTLRFYLFKEETCEGIPGYETSIYRGDIREGDGYQLNNCVIEITDVSLKENMASYCIYERGCIIKNGLLNLNDAVEFDFYGDGKVKMRLLSVHMGTVLPRALVEITISNYSASKLYVNEIIFHDIYTIPLHKGWNLVSTPLIPENPDVNAIFGDYEEVILPVYAWNPETRQYYEANTIEIGKGYWVLALDETAVTFTGTPYSC